MSRPFPDEFPFARRDRDADSETTAPEASAVAAEAPEAMEIFAETEATTGTPEAEEIFAVVELMTEADLVADDAEAEAPLASPGLSSAGMRRLVTPVVAPLATAAAAPAIVQTVGTAVADATDAIRTTILTAQKPGGAERRRSPRQALQAKATYRSEADVTATRTVRIVNLSFTGVRFWSNQPMSAGDRGNVRMEAGPVKWASRVRVVACEPRGDGGYEIGCEFVANELTPRTAKLVNPLVWAPVDRAEPQAA